MAGASSLEQTFKTFQEPENPDGGGGDASENGGELDLDGIDDQEIDKYILNQQEVEVKTELWMKQNHEYLQEQKEKEERINKEKEEGTYKEKKKRGRKREPLAASSAGEAIEKMLEKKKISSKINYDVLRDLDRGGRSPSSPASKGPSPAPSTKKPPNRRRQKNRNANQELAANANMMGKRFRRLISSTPKKKKTPPPAPAPVSMATEEEAPAPDHEICSAPLVAPPPLEEEAEEGEEGEECVSALKLVGDYGCEEEEMF